ncbi:diacylglycerol-acyltransferase [Neoconidiobolus thromboides FSU 785]|nr:diacylglycerol-acyltransferase [Neoconidiobolus thromboides FSU 785]
MISSNLNKLKGLISIIFFTHVTLASLILTILLFLNPLTFPFTILYYVHVFYDQTYVNGGSPSTYFKSLFIWKWFNEYFSSKVIFDSTISYDETYIFGYHPHGVAGFGVFANFASMHSNFYQQLPQFRLNIATLNLNFYLPFHREVLLKLGFISANKESLKTALEKGQSCLVVVGGASEALLANPKSTDVLLKNRFGFIKLALKTGKPLVPIFSFGENKLYTQLRPSKGSWLDLIQKTLKKALSFSTPIIYGRGFFQNSIGLLPKKVPIVSIIGNPIYVEKDENPSHEKIEQLLDVYKAELTRIYNKYKVEYYNMLNEEAPEIQFH